MKKNLLLYSVSIVEALKYEFEEFDKRPRTFGSEYEVELVNLKNLHLTPKNTEALIQVWDYTLPSR